MTIASKMIVATDGNGNRYLAGTLTVPLKAGSMLMLRKAADGSYSLTALSGRRTKFNRETLASFVSAEQLREDKP